ncbi:hypothetical protein COBT_002755 [Conglomerata obtusa]
MKIYYIHCILRISQIYSDEHQNVKLEDLLARIDAHNSFANDTIKQYINMNHSSLFIHIHYDANELYPIQPSIIINFILDIYFRKSKFPPIDVFALKYKEEKIIKQKNILFHLMQIYCRLFYASNHEKIESAESSNFFSIYLFKKIIRVREIFKLIKLVKKNNFFVINNGCKSDSDFMFFYRIISDLKVPQNYGRTSVNILFALKIENEIQDAIKMKLNKFELFKYSFPQFQYIKCTYKQNFMSCADIKNLQFLTKCNIYKDCNKENTSDRLYSNLKILKNEFFDGNKKILEFISLILNKIDRDHDRCIERLRENLKQGYNTYTFIVNNILNSYVFLFFVNVLRSRYPMNHDNYEKYIYKIVSVYYLHENKFLMYGRYRYINDPNIELDKKGFEFLETFKTNFQYLLNLNFLQFSNSLPSSRNLDYLKYPIWYNYHTGIYDLRHLNIKLNYKLLRSFIAFIEEKYGESSEITFLHASLNKKKQYLDLFYNENVFSILEMHNVIPKNEITKLKILTLDIFIIAIKNNKIDNQTCYIMFPLEDYEQLYQIFCLFYYWDYLQSSIKDSSRHNKCINTAQFLKTVIYNCIFKQIFLGFIRYDLQKYKDYILCRRRLYLFLILTNARYDFFLTEGINLDPTYLNWLRKLKNYKCILQSKKFTTFIDKHRESEAFKIYETHCYENLKRFCKTYIFCKENNNNIDNHMKIFYFFQTVHEITIDDVNGIISDEIQIFFGN